ncbi:MAG: ATP-binding cassette domain-containing protein [Oscillospiraceae bacterium]|nr:ATP-binding cassette domain-containing protein [Oscillospiraceae bacterium]
MEIRVINLNKAFGSHAVLKDINMVFPDGKRTVIMGDSGCGKTTLLRILMGLETSDSGEIVGAPGNVASAQYEVVGAAPNNAAGAADNFERAQHEVVSAPGNVASAQYEVVGAAGNAARTQHDVVGAPGNAAHTQREATCMPKHISAVFQEDRLMEDFSVISNIAFAAEKSVTTKVILRHLDEVDLRDSAWQCVRELSGGMKRRVAIVRAIVAKKELLLLDEPLKGLDEQTRERVAAYIRRHSDGVTTIMVTHDIDEAPIMDAAVIRMNKPAKSVTMRV